jgi:hypothetical protein
VSIRVESLTQPLEPITLPRSVPPVVDEQGQRTLGRTLAARDFSLGMQKLAQRMEAGDPDAALALLRQCVPDITDEEIDDLSVGEMLWIFGYCTERLSEMTAYLKNVGRAGAMPKRTPPSAPTTSTSTPSPASPARTGRTGSRSRSSRSTAPSTPLTA